MGCGRSPPYDDTSRPYSQLEGEGELAWLYSGFDDIHIRARLAFPADGGGRAGCILWQFFLLPELRYPAGGLYNGSTSWQLRHQLLRPAMQTFAQTRICTPLRCAFVETRSVFIPAIIPLRFTATVSGFSGGYAGFRSDWACGLRTAPSGRRLDLRALRAL